MALTGEKINVVRKEFYDLTNDIKQTVDKNLSVADSTLGQIDSTLSIISNTAIAKVDSLKYKTDMLEHKLNEALKSMIDKSVKENKEKVKQIIPGLPQF